MERLKCVSCGSSIYKSAHSDPYICRDCESVVMNEESRYYYLDSAL